MGVLKVVDAESGKLQIYSVYKNFYSEVPALERALEIAEEARRECGYEVYWSMLIYYIYHKRVFPLNILILSILKP